MPWQSFEADTLAAYRPELVPDVPTFDALRALTSGDEVQIAMGRWQEGAMCDACLLPCCVIENRPDEATLVVAALTDDDATGIAAGGTVVAEYGHVARAVLYS